jgi:hypothetical protein
VRSVARGAAALAALALGLGAWTPYAAAEPVDIGGQPVERSTDSAAPAALEAGLWSTQLAPEQPQYFTYERQIEDSTVHVGVIGTPPTADYDGFTVAAKVASPDDGTALDCGTGDAYSDSSFPQAAIGDEVVVGDEDSADDPCRASAEIRIEVERTSTSSTEPLPIALKIVEEAPYADRGEQIADDAELEYDTPEPVEQVDGPQGTGSFDDAPTVDAHEGPVTIAARLTEGDNLLWKVPLDWGDQLVVRGDLPTVEDGGPLDGVSAQVRIVQPVRDVFALNESEEYSYGDFTEAEAVLVAGAHPLRYDNRYRDFEPTLPGDYWVQVSIEPAPAEREPLDVELALTFAATQADGAAPTYNEAVLGQSGGAGPDGYSPETPYLVGNGEFSAVASGNPIAPEDEDDGWWGPRRGVGLGVGVVSLACCAVGAVWLTRRRSR